MKTYVYVDAFNLYFGCVKNTPYKWLDLSKLCAILLPQHQIERIKYFTAYVQGAAEQLGRAAAATDLHSRAADIVTPRDCLRSLSQPQRSDAAGAPYSRAA
jgi:hypothetical protein